MKIELAHEIYSTIMSTKLISLRDDLILNAIDYARIRVDWFNGAVEQKKEIDELRRIKHNVLIDNCNILCRQMSDLGEDSSWMAKLSNDRKATGDFACFVHLIMGLNSR